MLSLLRLTFTNQQLVVVDEPDGTLAPKASDHIDAHTVLTDSWDFSALIDICRELLSLMLAYR